MERRPWDDRDRAGRGQAPGERTFDRPPSARTRERFGPDRPSGGPPFRPRPNGPRPPIPGRFGRPPDRSGPRPAWQPLVAAVAAATADSPAPVEMLSEGEEIVAGRRPVEEAFAARREAMRLLVVPERRAALEQIVLHATTLRIPVVEVEGGTITAISGFDGHQGVALVVAPRRWATLDEVLALARTRGEPPLVLVLDHLEDPQNVGTLLRSAEACGVHGVLFPSHGAAPISPAAIKTSAGAVEHLLLVPLADLPGGMVDLHTRGVRIVGADGDASLTVREVDMRGPLAIVIGSEGRGLNARVRRRVDVTARIPMRGRVASLNASVAGSVFLFEAATQRWAVPPPPPAGVDGPGDVPGTATTESEAPVDVPDDASGDPQDVIATSTPGRSAEAESGASDEDDDLLPT